MTKFTQETNSRIKKKGGGEMKCMTKHFMRHRTVKFEIQNTTAFKGDNVPIVTALTLKPIFFFIIEFMCLSMLSLLQVFQYA